MSKALEQQVSELQAKVEVLFKSITVLADRLDRIAIAPPVDTTLKLKRG